MKEIEDLMMDIDWLELQWIHKENEIKLLKGYAEIKKKKVDKLRKK